MLQVWWEQEAKIVVARKGSRKVEKLYQGHWHKMETILHTHFIAVREQGKPVGQHWFI